MSKAKLKLAPSDKSSGAENPESSTSVDSLCVERLKALADKTRFCVVRSLAKGPMNVSELESELDIEQSLLSHHLRILRNAELVISSRDGKSVRYSIARDLKDLDLGDGVDLGCCKLTF